MKNILESHIPPDQQSDKPRPIYKIYDLAQPHCEAAKPYKDIEGKTRWQCKHHIDTESQTAADELTKQAQEMGLYDN